MWNVPNCPKATFSDGLAEGVIRRGISHRKADYASPIRLTH